MKCFRQSMSHFAYHISSLRFFSLYDSASLAPRVQSFRIFDLQRLECTNSEISSSGG